MHETVSLPDDERSVIANLFMDPRLDARRIELPAGTLLFDKTQRADNVYFIVEGQVRTYQAGPDDTSRLTDILGANDWLGAAALPQLPHYFSHAVTAAPSVVLEVPADRLLGSLSQRPEAAVVFIRHLVRKLYQAREDADRLVFDDCNLRLLKTLVRFSRSAAAAPCSEGVVLRITHHQLAQAVGVARETISLALTQLRHQNLLRTGRNQLFFNPDNLLHLTEQRTGKGINGNSGSNGNNASKHNNGSNGQHREQSPMEHAVL